MKRSKTPKIVFVFYEKTDQWVIKPLIRSLRSRGASCDVLDGFCYDNFIRPPNKKFRLRHSLNKVLSLKNPGKHTGSLAMSLIRKKIFSIETGIVFGRILRDRKRLINYLNRVRPDRLIVPENIRAAHGYLALSLAEQFKLKTTVIPPLYYEWVTTRPALGFHNAGQHIITSSAFGKRLHAANASGEISAILPAGNYLKKNIYKNIPKSASFPSPETNLFIAALQNKPEEDLFISLLVSAFARLPEKKLVIKFHPSSSPRFKNQMKHLKKPKNVTFSDTTLRVLLTKARALITISSTSALLAVGKRIPVITAHLDFFYHELTGLQKYYGCFPAVSNPDELTRAVEQLDHFKFHQRFVRKQEKLRCDFFKQDFTPKIAQRIMAGL